MKQMTKLKICDWTLLALTVGMLASGIQLEAMNGGGAGWVWTHIAVGLLFMGLCGWHVWLHFKKSDWFARFRKLKSQWTRVLWWVALLTFLTGIIATVHWLAVGGHSPVGGVHGKLGFLMLLLAAGHAVKRRRFYLR